MKRKTLKYTATVAALAAVLQASPAFAAVTQDQINATQGQINTFETKMQQLDNQVTIEMDKSQKLTESIQTQQEKIEQTKKDIQNAQNDLDAHKRVYSDRLRSYQSENQMPVITYAEVLLSSKNMSDFLTRTTAITQILQSDSDMMNSLNQKEENLKNTEKSLHNELNRLKESQDELATDQKKIESDKAAVEKELADSKDALTKQQAEEKAQQLAQQAAEQKAATQVATQPVQQPVQKQTVAEAVQQVKQQPAASAGKASAVISYAEQFLGVPYVWGGTTPSGFDCSGLMQYVFRSVGVSLPRVSQDQQNVGTRISVNDVQPGDLVFMGEPAYHVGMYIGGGKWIEAPETGENVKIANYIPSMFSSAARVLN